MKKFLSFLLVLVFALGSAGVVFALTFTPGGSGGGGDMSGGDVPAPSPAIAPLTGADCAKNETMLVDGKCEACPSDKPEYNSISEGCVTRKENCEASGKSTWDVEKCSDPNGNGSQCCLGKKDYCNGKKQGYDKDSGECKQCNLPEIYDDTIKDCHNPNLTPSTLLPDTEYKETVCEQLFLAEASKPGVLKAIIIDGKEAEVSGFAPGEGVSAKVSPLDILGCAIKTGRVRLWMIPFYIKYFIQFALSLAGLIAVGSIIVGGYFYLFGAFADDKDKGKRAIIYGIVGFIVAILSWTIVNIVISVLTR